MFLKDRNQAFEEAGFGVIIGFSDPDILTLSKPHALVPLLERAAGVRLIEFDPRARIACVLLQDGATLVRGAIVQQNQFEILVCLA